MLLLSRIRTPMALGPVQCKMARAALDMGVRDLAKVADVSPNTIARLERGDVLHVRTQAYIRGALEAEGVIFLESGVGSFAGGTGVRLGGQDKSRYADLFERLWAIPDMRRNPEKALHALIDVFDLYLSIIEEEGREPDTWERLDLNEALNALASGKPHLAFACLRRGITPPDNQSPHYPIAAADASEASELNLAYFRRSLARVRAPQPLAPLPSETGDVEMNNSQMPVDKGADRAQRNFLSATAMLGHLCALFDRGVFESGRLMSNLIYQLAVKRRNNSPLLERIVDLDRFRVVVDVDLLIDRIAEGAFSSPLVGMFFGLRKNEKGDMEPTAAWVPTFLKPNPTKGFSARSLDEWLDQPVIPAGSKVLSRRELVLFVRDQDGGAHSDPDEKLQKSPDYVEVVNSFPMSKQSSIRTPSGSTLPWNLLPPVTLPIMRQMAHELLSAIHSQTDVGARFYLPSLICQFKGEELMGAFVPEEYPNVGPVHGKTPGVIARAKNG
jgi:transcriptional regulator with XRE-family HTH domain